jgi:hypothetical protein
MKEISMEISDVLSSFRKKQNHQAIGLMTTESDIYRDYQNIFL